ncbi:hypothetical protein GCM10028857_02040 [Salinarchaeum chitinilyticum]
MTALASNSMKARSIRLALVARRFVQRELGDSDARGITSGDRFAIEWFDAIVGYEEVAVESL